MTRGDLVVAPAYPDEGTSHRGARDDETGADRDTLQACEREAAGDLMVVGSRIAVEYAREADLRPEHFYWPKYGHVLDAAYTLYDAGKNIDTLSIANLLEHRGELARMGGYPEIAAIAGCSLTPHSIGKRAEEIKDAYGNRLMIILGARIEQAGRSGNGERGAVMREFASLVEQIGELENGVREQAEQRMPRVDFSELFAEDFTQVDWLPGRFLERGQQMALVGEGKAGKSLLVLEWVWRAIRGERFLGDTRREPLRVQYWDRENSRADLFHRLRSLGATEADLGLLTERLDYRQFPAFAGQLDESAAAAVEFMGAVEQFKPDLVVIDTISRFIAGKENDSDTFLAFYRRVHVPLKAAGTACVRLDHFGKDSERGSRGSSAKTQDVDTVWELAVSSEPEKIHDRGAEVETIVTQLRMHRTHTRSGLGDDTFRVVRRAQQELTANGVRGMWLPGRTSHALLDSGGGNAHSNEVEGYVDSLIGAGLDEPLGRDKMRAWASERGVKLPGKATSLADIASALRARLSV